MNPRWLLHASRWARNPPSAKRVVLGLGVVAACLLLAGIEWVFDLDVEAERRPDRIFTSP